MTGLGGVASGRMLYELTQHQGVYMARNMQVLLASRPTGWVEESNFKIVEADVPKPGPGEVLVKNLWLSLDPYARPHERGEVVHKIPGDRRSHDRRHGRPGGRV